MLHMLPVQLCTTVQKETREGRVIVLCPIHPTNSTYNSMGHRQRSGHHRFRSESEIWQTLVFRKQLYYTIMSLFSFSKNVDKSQQVQMRKVKICLEQ